MYKLQHRLIVLLALLSSQQVSAVTINASSDWSDCNLQDNITTAGDYYATTLTSDSAILSCSNAFISINNTDESTTTWAVSSRLVTNTTGMTMELIRTGNGAGDSSPAGGDNYIPLTTAFTPIFTGQGNISSIPIHFRISNFDVTDGHGNQNFQIEHQIITD